MMTILTLNQADMEIDSPKLLMDSPNLSRVGSFVHESSFVRDVIDSLPVDNSPPIIFLNGEQLFSDAMSVERIGDEWLGPSYANDGMVVAVAVRQWLRWWVVRSLLIFLTSYLVDLRDDFANQMSPNQSGGKFVLNIFVLFVIYYINNFYAFFILS